jgi:hypothetical protein
MQPTARKQAPLEETNKTMLHLARITLAEPYSVSGALSDGNPTN